jgi:hypothetical protein
MPVRDGDREAGRNERSLAGREFDAFTSGEVEAGVAVIGTRRDDRIRAQPLDRQLDQADSRWLFESATRNGANRGRSRLGNRAMIATPAAVSSRSSIGVPSA